MRNVYQNMTLWRARNEQPTGPKMPWQDVYKSRPGFTGKGGIGGVLDQPVKYLSDWAYEKYQVERKARALGYYAQYHGRRFAQKQIVKYYYWNKYYRAKIPKKYEKKPSRYGYSKFQKSAKFRPNQYRSRFQECVDKYGYRQCSRWSNFRRGQRRSYRKYY